MHVIEGVTGALGFLWRTRRTGSMYSGCGDWRTAYDHCSRWTRFPNSLSTSSSPSRTILFTTRVTRTPETATSGSPNSSHTRRLGR